MTSRFLPDMNRVKDILFRERTLLMALCLMALLVSIQKYFGGPAKYDNYLIFKRAFFDVLHHENPYGLKPSEYLYSPSFAILFGPLAILPDLLGIILFCLANAIAVYLAIQLFPTLSVQKKAAFIGIILFELVTAQQNLQTNPLIGAFIILAFCCLEREKPVIAALLLVLTFYVKIYGLVAAVMFLFYPKKNRFILSTLIWMLVVGLMPLILTSWDELIDLYKGWFNFTGDLHNNATVNYSSSLNTKDPALSVMSLFHAGTGLQIPSLPIQAAGGIITMSPLLRISEYSNLRFRIFTLSSFLIFFVIFNHMAESPSYIIAMMGVACWYLFSEKNKVDTGLLIFAILFVSLSPTDLFPKVVRETFVKPYVLKALPCFLIWGLLQFRLWSKFTRDES